MTSRYGAAAGAIDGACGKKGEKNFFQFSLGFRTSTAQAVRHAAEKNFCNNDIWPTQFPIRIISQGQQRALVMGPAIRGFGVLFSGVACGAAFMIIALVIVGALN